MDYSELKTNYKFKDIESFDPVCLKYAKDDLNPRKYKYVNAIINIALLLCIVISIFYIFVSIFGYTNREIEYDGSNYLLMSIGPISLLLSIVCFVTYRLDRRKKLLHLYTFYMFAIKNNLSYVYKSNLKVLIDSGLIYLPDKGVVYSIGRNKKYSDLLGNSNISLGNFSYLTSNGENTQEHNWVVGSIKLSRYLPHIILDTKSNNNMGFCNLPETFQRNQITNAEPALIDYFNLYAPPDYKIDSLSFVAPDLIDVLKRNFTDYDMEIIDDTLYIYFMGNITKEGYVDMFSKMQLLSKALEDNIDTYIDARATSAIRIKGLDSISPDGRRLVVVNRSKIITIFVFSIYILFILAIIISVIIRETSDYSY